MRGSNTFLKGLQRFFNVSCKIKIIRFIAETFVYNCSGYNTLPFIDKKSVRLCYNLCRVYEVVVSSTKKDFIQSHLTSVLLGAVLVNKGVYQCV